jgi:histidine triad (HIT) family protein
MPGIFAQIIAGQIPSYKIAENETCFAFLDVFPLVPGHTLVVPKIEVDNIHELDTETHAALFAFSKQIARAIGKAIPCKKVGMAVVGLEVPHAHVHLVPIDSADDLNFTRPKLKMDQEALLKVQQRILEHLNQ